MLRRSLLVLVLSGILAGCGPRSATVQGEVTVDGEPLEKGTICYTPADSQGTPVTVPVEKGKYQLQTLPGRKWVQISAPVVVGKRPEYNGPGAPLVEITEERLPEQFNSRTELSLDVQAGSNSKSWAVTSKKAQP